MSRSPRHDAAQPVDSALAAALQGLTGALIPTTDVESRLAAAVYAASLPPAPRVRTSVDQLLTQGRRELLDALEATTDVDSRLTLTLSAIDLAADHDHTSSQAESGLPSAGSTRTA